MSSWMFAVLAGVLYTIFQIGKYVFDKQKNPVTKFLDAYTPGMRRIEAELESMSISQAQRQAWRLLDRSPYLVTTPPDSSAPGPAFDQLTADQRDLLGRYASIGTKEEEARMAAADVAPCAGDPQYIRIGATEYGDDLVVQPGREPVSERDDEGDAGVELKSIWHWIVYWHLEAELTATSEGKPT